MKQQSKSMTTAIERVLIELQEAVSDPSTAANKAAAEAIVSLRRHFKHEGAVDWTGRSPEYRDCIERLYRQAGVPSDSVSNMQANLRYHIGNTLRKVAPPEDLAALGMAVEGPLGRIRQARSNGHTPRSPRIPRPGVGDPAALASLALEAVRTLATMEPGPEVEVPLRRVMDEALSVLRRLPTSV